MIHSNVTYIFTFLTLLTVKYDKVYYSHKNQRFNQPQEDQKQISSSDTRSQEIRQSVSKSFMNLYPKIIKNLTAQYRIKKHKQ